MLVTTALLAAAALATVAAAHDDDDGGDATATLMTHGACSPAAVAHAWVAAWNEQRFEALDTMFTPDALVYVNGKLDDLNDGRPATPERNTCVHGRGRLEYHVGDVTTSGHTVAATSGTMLVQRAMTGVAVVFELDAATCRIETQRFFFSTESEAYRQYASEFLCNCYPLLEELGQCHAEEAPAPIDVAQLFEQCLREFVTGDADAFAACYADNVRYTVNGVAQPSAQLADADTVRRVFDDFSVQLQLDHSLAEGFTLHAVVSGTKTARSTGESADSNYYVVAKFNEDGIIVEQHEAADNAATSRLTQRITGAPPTPQFWKSQAALNALGGFVAQLGFPTDYTDFLDPAQTNFAVWLAADLAAVDGACFTEVTVTDRDIIHRAPSPHVDFATASVRLAVPEGRANDVRAVTDSLVYDELTNTLTSTNNGLGHAVIDLHLGARVARGQLSVSQAQATYGALFASVFTAQGELSAEWFRLRGELCSLVQ